MKNELRTQFSKLYSKLDKVVFESRKYNLIDRFFHFAIEKEEMQREILNQKVEENVYSEIMGLLELEKDLILTDIEYCFGFHSFTNYLKSDKTIFIENPSLLGISPFLFSQTEWIYLIQSEIEKSRFKTNDLYNIELMIINNLQETLFRLNKKHFNLSRWDEGDFEPLDIFLFVRDKIFETAKNSKSINQDFLKIVQDNSLKNSSRIVLTGNFNIGKLKSIIIERFGKESIKLNKDDLLNINGFISQNFKNAVGKSMQFNDITSISFFSKHIKLIKKILIENVKKGNIICTEKDIARIINNSLPALGELKTIENY